MVNIVESPSPGPLAVGSRHLAFVLALSRTLLWPYMLGLLCQKISKSHDGAKRIKLARAGCSSCVRFGSIIII